MSFKDMSSGTVIADLAFVVADNSGEENSQRFLEVMDRLTGKINRDTFMDLVIAMRALKEEKPDEWDTHRRALERRYSQESSRAEVTAHE